MSTKEMDAVLSRWFMDGKFRQQLREDPEVALAGYNLSPAHRARLLNLKKPAHMSPDRISEQSNGSRG